MIVETMTPDEILNELDRIEIKLDRRQDNWDKKYKKEIAELKINDIKYLQYNKLNDNMYFILSIGKATSIQGYGYIYIVQLKGKWIALLKGSIKNEFNIRLSIYEAHFFERYKQRCNINNTGVELIFHYFKHNFSIYSGIDNINHNGKEYYIGNGEEGVSLCEIERLAIGCVIKHTTFVSNDMLKSEQIELIENLEENIEELKEKEKNIKYK